MTKFWQLLVFAFLSASLFSQTNEQDHTANKSNRSSILKLNVVQTMIGEFLIGWEQQYFPRFSLEAELGICMPEIDKFFLEANHYQGLSYYPEDAGLYVQSLKTQTTPLLGPAISLGARFYANDKKGSLSGWYLGPNISYKRVNYSLTAYDSFGTQHLETEKGNNNVFTISLNAGYQFKIKRFIVDPYFGLKTYFNNHNALAAIVSWKKSAWEYKWYHVNSKANSALPTIGLRIGYLIR